MKLLTMPVPGDDYWRILFGDHEPPCLSLYQPTHRHHPDNRQDPIRYRNLVDSLERMLRDAYPTAPAGALLEPFRALADDAEFWNHARDGLAVLGARRWFQVHRLQRPVPELAVVANSFHTKPLLRIHQSADRYHVLALDRQKIRLFEGNRDALDEVEPAKGVPRSLTEALGEERTEPHLTVASYGTGARGPAMHHGHGSRKDEVDVDTERFFLAVDRAIMEHHSRPSGLPIVLAALPEHQSVFRTISRNPFLLAAGIESNPADLSAEELRARAWTVVEPGYAARLSALVEEFGRARSKELGSADPAEIGRAAATGRVATLLVDADRRVAGRLDPATGRIATGGAADAGTDDVLDDLGELVLRRGGDVVIVPGNRMPTSTGVAAIHRF